MSVAPYANMAVNFSQLVKNKANVLARTEYNKNYPERKGTIFEFSYPFEFMKDH